MILVARLLNECSHGVYSGPTLGHYCIFFFSLFSRWSYTAGNGCRRGGMCMGFISSFTAAEEKYIIRFILSLLRDLPMECSSHCIQSYENMNPSSLITWECSLNQDDRLGEAEATVACLTASAPRALSLVKSQPLQLLWRAITMKTHWLSSCVYGRITTHVL